jgi:hypothetical protein
MLLRGCFRLCHGQRVTLLGGAVRCPPPLTTIFGFGLALSFHGSVEQAPKPGRSGALFEEQVWGTSLIPTTRNKAHLTLR